MVDYHKCYKLAVKVVGYEGNIKWDVTHPNDIPL